MTNEPWQPLSVRLAGRKVSLREGVPEIVEAPLRDWILDVTQEYGGVLDRVRIRLELWDAEYEPDPDPPPHIRLALESGVSNLLDIADALLSLLPANPPLVDPWTAPEDMKPLEHREALQALLEDAQSAYRVSSDGTGLERRASASASMALDSAISAGSGNPDAGSAAGHLQAAWGAIHDFAPDPVRAYSEAIKATEAAAHAVVEPANVKATLGTMIRQLRSNPGAYKIALPGRGGPAEIDAVATMMALLWNGQTSRHGGKEPTRPETVQQAKMAVHLAVTLVEWFAEGGVRRC